MEPVFKTIVAVCIIIPSNFRIPVLVMGASIVSTKSVQFHNFDGCTVPLPVNRHFAPIITDQETRLELKPVVDPTSGLWYFRTEQERKIKASCGRGNKLSHHESFYYQLLTCVRGVEFRDDADDHVHLSDGLACSEPRKPTPIVYRNGTCFGNATNLDVEFVTESPPRKYYSVCFDESISGTLYSSSYIDGESIANGLVESTGNRPDFRGQEFYPFPIKSTYKWENAFEHLSNLLGSEDVVNEYFPTPQFRFSRGHMFPNGDGIKKFEKHATFYYVNTVPQWQNLNGGNWAVIEQASRDLAEGLSRRLTVITGAFGVTTLKDENNNEVELWLARDDTGRLRLPVPRLVWKLVHDPVGNAAVAIVQVNNPWLQPTENDILCSDICSSLPWLRSSDLHVLRKGYTYCCDVNELRKSIPYVPSVQYSQLLGVGYVSDSDGESDDDSNIYSDDSSDSTQSDTTSDSESSEGDDMLNFKNFKRENITNVEESRHNITKLFVDAFGPPVFPNIHLRT